MFPGIGFQELLIIGVVAILLFGKRLPEVARSWGQSYREFRRSVNEIRTSFTDDSPRHDKPRRTIEYDDRIEDKTPRFVPPSEDVSASPPPSNTAG